MLTPKESDFVAYWEAHRLEKKRVIKQLAVGLPLGVALVAAIFANVFSGWYGRAQMVMFRESASLVIVLLIAAVGIVLFMVIFSARHRWDQNEQQYRELLARSSASTKS